MDDKEFQTLDLEDILKEFSDAPEEEVSEDVQAMEAFLDEDRESAMTRDTIRMELDNLQKTVDTMGDTIRLDTIAQAVEQEAEQPREVPQAAAETVEPYSKDWEPEYEQPIGEYIPPKPIIFQPRSRLRELKRKLVAGPEKRYYELSELGLGKLQMLILLSLVVAVVSAGATVLYAAGMVGQNRMKLMVFGQFFALLLSALLGSQQMLDGICDMLNKRFSLNAMLVFTFAACFVDGICCLKQLRVPCCAAFSLQVVMALWAAYNRRATEMSQMDTMRKATRLDSVTAYPDYYEGLPGLLRSEGQVEDFMDNYAAPTAMEKTLSVYAFVALLVSIGSCVAAYVLHGSGAFAAQVLSASLLTAVPVTAYISQTRPMAILQKRLHGLGTVLCGWQGIKAMSRRSVFPLTHEDLFPAGSCNLNGVKFYGTRDPDEVVAYATALICADGGGLVPLFEYLLDSRNGRHYEVENMRAYPGGGLGGEVEGESVLVGTPGFLKDMGVEIPQGTRVNQAVYAAIDGELCGLFAVNYDKDKAAAAGLNTLCSYRKLQPVLTSFDFMLTESFIRSRFGVNIRRMGFPERAVRRELAGKEAEKGTPALALVTQVHGGLAPFAFAVTGAKQLRKAGILGVVIHMLGGILGLAMMLALAILGAKELLTPVNMLLFELIWLVPGFLVTEWTRSV